ncbi:MAG: FxsA family protein, partial [Spirochaetales bacterium]|nr:FxsA family protein [Spirochaetales bacterium]
MLSTKGLMRIIDRSFLLKALYLLLLYSLVPVGEIALMLYLKPFVGSYLLIALVLFTGLLGGGVAWRLVSSSLQALGDRVRAGSYPREDFSLLAGSLIAGILLVTPGFITDVLGFLFALRFFRRATGNLVTAK